MVEFDELSDSRLLAEKAKHEPWLSRQAGVTGIGIGLDRRGRRCVKIYTCAMSGDTKRAIEAVLSQIPFDFEETGEIRAP